MNQNSPVQNSTQRGTEFHAAWNTFPRSVAERPVEAPLARLGSPDCQVDGFLRRGGEEAGLVASTGLPRPAAFKRCAGPRMRPEDGLVTPSRLLTSDQGHK